VKAGTLFSGIGAPECAAPDIDWRWCAEIDPFASAVHAARFPGVVNLGDVEQIDAGAVEPVDLIVFGSPCQSFSVAGKRLGLDDPRGNLALVGLRLIGRIRPKWVVWENVPGILSSDGGRDFGAFLGCMAELGYGFAYAVLDAQHFGVPQRRRRVFAVGRLGDWRGPAAVLFEQSCLRGDSAPRREAGERIVAGAAFGISPDCFDRTGEAASGTAADGFDASEDGTGRGTPLTVALRGREGGATAELGDDVGLAVRASQGGGDKAHILAHMSVRRLTPRECERLQGFPDDFTAITYRGKPAADGPRYRALGNSMAVPVIGWIVRRLAAMKTGAGTVTLTKQERELGYREMPRPPVWADPILRRIAGGYLLLTMAEDGAFASYSNGTPIMMPATRNRERVHTQMDSDTVKMWVKHGWLIPIEGESLFSDGPPQRYRARTLSDGILPRIIDKNGKAHWTLKPGE
jgi:DNA (cytosine-5)-methyltransferase 1